VQAFNVNFEVKYLMKKVISVFLIALMLCSVVGCGSDKTENSKPSNDGTTSNNEQIEYEKPYEGNAAILPMQMHSPYDNQAEALRKEIIDLPDTLLKNKNIYYVSYRAKQGGDGKSPETAWNSLAFIDVVPEGSTILFERGGVYRGKLYLKKGITLAAYGTGYKPAIYGSSKNYGDESLWKKTSTENVWVANTSAEGGDIGVIVFDHGAKTSTKRVRLERLKKDYDMFVAGTQTYVYLSKGNPGKIHKNIEMAGIGNGTTPHIITGYGGIKNVTIDNLCIKYGGIHGIQFTNGENITITNCEIGYIGGATSKDYGAAWLGNGIELWESCKNVLVDNCWVYQCYDAGITNQGRACTQENITFSNNLVEYCAYNVEYFVNQDTTGKMKNIIYSDNILRFAGFGCFDPTNRQGGAEKGQAVSLICGWGTSGRTYNCENFIFKNNILDTSYRYMISVTSPSTDRNAKFEGNTYYQKKSDTALICITGENTAVKATSDSQFKAEISKFDAKAKAAELVG